MQNGDFIVFFSRSHVIWLLKQSNTVEVTEVLSFSKDARAFLNQIIYKFDLKDSLEMKNIEENTYHDAMRVVLKNFQLESTFENIDNLNFAFSLNGALDNVIFPNINELREAIFNMADKTASIPMVSRPYHPKVSSILGEKMLIIAHILNEQIEEFNKVLLSGKFVGVVAGYPEFKWAAIIDEFVRSFGLHFYPYKTKLLATLGCTAIEDEEEDVVVPVADGDSNIHSGRLQWQCPGRLV
ncbi:hypothetical protein Taro_031049 [Colocasia esculenta]|uniref:Uncharacterized protein n=1 Tax=Colocasia esculenta TaxID=4460 RepID=A0A843VNZ4_COLES|nr:hypothetical protein [Colocasia esculenta]